MTVEEFDTALSDLETRVDRLRALYENWFRGYEKTEPGVARKDVERRVYGLRKELPRNTALRFRYHQLYQRYTTLATYWQRTARQIEEGTYRRQLQRIKRRRDDEVARTLAPPPRPEESSAPPPAFELNVDETLDVRKLLDDFDLDQVANALDVSLPAEGPPSKATGQIAAHVRSARTTVPDVSAPNPPVTSVAPPVTPKEAQAPAAAEQARTVGRFARPSASAGNGAPSVAAPRPPALSPANDTKPVAPKPANDVAPAKPPALPAAARGTGSVPMPPPPSGRGTGTVPMPPPPSGRGTGTVPRPPPPSRPSAAAPMPPPPPRPAPPTAPRAAQVSSSVPAARAPTISGTVARVEGLDEQRMRRIYEEYAAAKRRNNEGEVRYETLAGSISKMLPDLTKKHAGKQIDFEVVLKDGRVGLKPKAT